MSAPAGPCEWCGGPQHWTTIRGEVYVSCDMGCLPLPMEGFAAAPPDGDGPEETPKVAEMEPEERERVAPCEGAADRTSDIQDPELPW